MRVLVQVHSDSEWRPGEFLGLLYPSCSSDEGEDMSAIVRLDGGLVLHRVHPSRVRFVES